MTAARTPDSPVPGLAPQPSTLPAGPQWEKHVSCRLRIDGSRPKSRIANHAGAAALLRSFILFHTLPGRAVSVPLSQPFTSLLPTTAFIRISRARAKARQFSLSSLARPPASYRTSCPAKESRPAPGSQRLHLRAGSGGESGRVFPPTFGMLALAALKQVRSFRARRPPLQRPETA